MGYFVSQESAKSRARAREWVKWNATEKSSRVDGNDWPAGHTTISSEEWQCHKVTISLSLNISEHKSVQQTARQLDPLLPPCISAAHRQMIGQDNMQDYRTWFIAGNCSCILIVSYTINGERREWDWRRWHSRGHRLMSRSSHPAPEREGHWADGVIISSERWIKLGSFSMWKQKPINAVRRWQSWKKTRAAPNQIKITCYHDFESKCCIVHSLFKLLCFNYIYLLALLY